MSHATPSLAPVELCLPDWLAEVLDGQGPCTDARQQVALAIELSRHNVEHDTGGPFGAVVFAEDGELIAAGVNRVLPQHCSVAHAEIMAFIGAQRRLGRARINEDGRRYVLATSAQPCCQCYGASIWAGIDGLRIGARAEDVMALTEFDEGPLPADWIGELRNRGIAVERDILRDEARAVLRAYGSGGGARY
ncbi:MAG TPA: nucleoside deaminase [Gammaproteobacteria bacterium]|nr:nucleoside deaminase [Gammaproteobacteria bacterium]